MIDPRALQQHFRKIHEKQLPRAVEPSIPRILDSAPLTAIQPVIIEQKIDTSKLQEELLEVTQALTTLKQSLSQTPIIEPITVTVPVSVATIVNEPELKKEPEDKNPYGYSAPKLEDKDIEEYNPYGYYSGPRF